MRVPLLIALVLTATAAGSEEFGPAVGVASSPAELVASCSSADTEAIGLPQLEAVCPGLEHALVELGYAPFISENQLDVLNVHSLVDLQRLADRYRGPQAEPADEIAVATLAPVLESLQQEQRAERPLTWFERLKKWLRSVFEQQQQGGDSWLGRWLDDWSIPEQVTDWIIYGLITLVMVLAVAVVFNEARAAGLLKRGARRRSPVMAAGTGLDPAHMTLADLDSVAPGDRPSLLLRMLVGTLVKAGRLRAEKSLTHRELSQRAAFDEMGQRECFQQVAALGERLLYGGSVVEQAEIERVVQAGRVLNAQLATPKAAT